MIELKSGETILEVDPKGAFLVSLRSFGKDILFPRTQLKNKSGEIKTRGGLHVCLPNFGPDNKFDLNQHGFGRELTWQVIKQSANRVVLLLEGGAKPYKKLQSVLEVDLSDRKLNLKLILKNLNDEVLEVAPAFHPYFATKKDEVSFRLNDEILQLNELEGTIFRDNVKSAKIGGREIIFNQTNLNCFAIWTDLLGNYVCVEPSFAGNAFVDGGTEELGAGGVKVYGFGFEW